MEPAGLWYAATAATPIVQGAAPRRLWKRSSSFCGAYDQGWNGWPSLVVQPNANVRTKASMSVGKGGRRVGRACARRRWATRQLGHVAPSQRDARHRRSERSRDPVHEVEQIEGAIVEYLMTRAPRFNRGGSARNVRRSRVFGRIGDDQFAPGFSEIQ
jgi:hypothetical protein